MAVTAEAFVRSVQLRSAEDGKQHLGHPWELPAIDALRRGLELHPKVTYLIGENGSGKSTLLEALAVAAGMNAEGTTSTRRPSTRCTSSPAGRPARSARR